MQPTLRIRVNQPANAFSKAAMRAFRRTTPQAFLLFNHNDTSQSLILTGLLAPSTKAPNNLFIGVANGAFNGISSPRVEYEPERASAQRTW
ncbi:hypothetical protein [Xanthomonas sp. MUS 060]|uniref:hypothetical protein n=1 Tax=Xanthomonas sp. MUS 060 TaxID=1588031 RepID=UPI001F15B8BE|nr:hypothetical protein [Xanthomonas sp. MUS 060]